MSYFSSYCGGTCMSDEIPEPDLRLLRLPPRDAGRSAATTKPRKLAWGNRIARVLLALIAALGLFLSMTPWGRADVRGVMLLPGLLAARHLGPIVASVEPIRHISLTVPSQR